MPEWVLRCLWYDHKLREPLRDDRNAPVWVVSPGRWNLDAGPDFLEARLRTGRSIVRGDVEVHVASSDWRTHGHDRDPAFNDVALHVVLENSPGFVTRTGRGRRVPTVSLAERWTVDLARQRRRLEAHRYPFGSVLWDHPVVDRLGDRGDRLVRVLDRVGEGRLRQKSRRIRARALRWGWSAALYLSLLDLLGGPMRRAAFRRVGRAVPWTKVRRVLAASTRRNRARELGAVFLQSWSGDPERLRNRIRPNARGERRLLGLARILAKTSPLPGEVLHVFREGGGDARSGVDRRRALIDCLGGAPGAVGEGWRRVLAFNVLIPWVYARGAARSDRGLMRAARLLWRRWPPLPSNRITRWMTVHLWGRRGAPRKVLGVEMRRQGLIGLYRGNCGRALEECARGVGPPCGLLASGADER